MKKFLILILALCMVLPLASCDGKETNDSLKGDKYVASHSHLYPYSDPLRFDNEEYYAVIDGDKAELVQISYESDANDSGAYTEEQKTRLTGSVKLEDGYYVITVKKLYNSVKIVGEGAKSHKNDMIQNARDAIAALDKESSDYKNYKARYELMIDLYSGKEVDATSMSLSEFDTVVYKVKLDDKLGKITEMIMLADGKTMGGYTYEYDSTGRIARSTEYDNDGDVWETEYRSDGTPSFFKYTTEEEVLSFTCDKAGNVTEIAKD